MKKILIIASYFPPFGRGSGRLRTLKLSKYLLEHGWRPYILTVNEKVYNCTDDSLMREIPDAVTVFRTMAFDTRELLSIKGRYFKILATPDSFIGWLPFAVIKGRQIIRREGINIIYSTSPLPTAHMIGLVLKKVTKLPWITDFRDPWVEETGSEGWTGVCCKIEKYLERKTIINSDGVVATTQLLKKDLMARYHFVDRNRFHVIENGFDEDDFVDIDLENKDAPEKFEILHAGAVNNTYRSPGPLLSAISGLIEEKRLSRKDVRLRFLGPGSYLKSPEFRDTLSKLRIGDIVEVLDSVSYKDCIDYQRGAAVLLLLQGGEDTRTLIPAKAFEYLRVARPILCLAPKGVTSQLIDEFKAGIVVNSDDIEGIKKAIMEFYQSFKEGDLRVSIDQNKLKKYSRRELTGKFATILNEVSQNNG